MMERKIWTKSEFLNKYYELRRQGLNDKQIKELFNMNYMSISNFRNLHTYFKYLSDDEHMNNIIKMFRKSIDEVGTMYINEKLWATADPLHALKIAVAVLKNEGYREWFVTVHEGSEDDEEKNTYHLLASPKYDHTDILDFVKKTGQIVTDDI